MRRTHHQIPQKVPQRETLTQSPTAIIPPNPHRPQPLIITPPNLPLLIEPNNPQTDPVDYDRLHETDDVHVPVQLAPAREAGVGFRGYAGGDEGRDGVAGEGVEEGGEDDFVEVEREGREVEFVRPGFDEAYEGGGWGDGEGVEHAGGDGGLWSMVFGTGRCCGQLTAWRRRVSGKETGVVPP